MLLSKDPKSSLLFQNESPSPDAWMKLEAISCAGKSWRIQTEGKWVPKPHGWIPAFKGTHKTSIISLVSLWLMFYVWFLFIRICVLISQMYGGPVGQWSTNEETLLIPLGNLGRVWLVPPVMTWPAPLSTPNPLSHDDQPPVYPMVPQREQRQMSARHSSESPYLKIFK